MIIERHILKTEQKALEINLNEKIYGTFAEIGAGQEVARNFFQAGAAMGTIAKTMSAYDKVYSDAIYGAEESGRYVCEARIYKMLDHEYGLMEERLTGCRPETCFFAFADSVAAINYTKTIKGQGFLGLRFQIDPDGEPNEFVLHVKMLDNDNKLQQEAIGVLGVNLIYACYFLNQKPEEMMLSLIDSLQERVEIDFVRLTGPDFRHIDNRLMSFYLVKHDLTEVAMFDSSGKSVHASEFLYKKPLMVVRGNYRPPTNVTLDVFDKSFKQFKKDLDENIRDNSFLITELTLDNMRKKDGELNENDFLQRADLLCALGETVIISDCNNHQKLINYLADYKIKKLGIVIGVHELGEIIHHKYEQNQDGRLLVAFGELFTRNIKIYVYPAYDDKGKLITANNLKVPDGITFLYKHLLGSEQVVCVEEYDEEGMRVLPYELYKMIKAGKTGWEKYLPPTVSNLIKEKGYLGYPVLELETNV